MVSGPGMVVLTGRFDSDWATRQSWGRKGSPAATAPRMQGKRARKAPPRASFSTRFTKSTPLEMLAVVVDVVLPPHLAVCHDSDAGFGQIGDHLLRGAREEGLGPGPHFGERAFVAGRARLRSVSIGFEV